MFESLSANTPAIQNAAFALAEDLLIETVGQYETADAQIRAAEAALEDGEVLAARNLDETVVNATYYDLLEPLLKSAETDSPAVTAEEVPSLMEKIREIMTH